MAYPFYAEYVCIRLIYSLKRYLTASGCFFPLLLLVIVTVLCLK